MKDKCENKTANLVKGQIEKAVHSLDPSATPSDSTYKACAVMFAALFLGPKPLEIADVMGYDHHYVIDVAARMRASGMWTEFTDWGQDINSLDAIMDSIVAEGILIRTQEKRDGRHIYRALIYDGQLAS